MQRYDYTTQRLFVLDDLQQNGTIVPDRAQANYLLNVLRMKNGANVLLFNGRDGEWLSEVNVLARKSCELRLLSQTRIQPAPYDLIYMFAPLKKGRLDYMVQKAVEMGVGTLQPVITEFTQNTKLNLDRIRSNVAEAAEQCGILSIAEVAEPVKLETLLQSWDSERTIIYADEASGDENCVTALGRLKGQKQALLIGPEGGFSDAERQQLRAMTSVLPISLGPRILRADTAAVAALAIVQAAAGDW